MMPGIAERTESKPGASASTSLPIPSVTLPKGGGAIRGIGEKFAANPVTGTGSMTVPVFTSPGRSGFSPQLSLSYDSGAGAGPFGLGWALSLSAITRKTDQGLPRYRDAEESDVFVLSGAEDLVPVLAERANGNWAPEVVEPRIVNGMTYTIRRYRPRVEGLFARIERWTNRDDPSDVFWRSISSDNITSWYGRTGLSRIADPADPSRIFSWLLCETHDAKGNVIAYEYKPEDSSGVSVSHAHERNRTVLGRSVQRYIKQIRYGNRTPYLPVLGPDQPWPPLPKSADWLLEVIFDYGDHDPALPTPDESGVWSCRPDPFSAYRAGFEVRTYRLCQRVLMFHRFAKELGEDCLVRSTDLVYRYEQDPGDPRNPIHSVVTGITQNGYRRKADGSYLQRSLPALSFEYSEAVINENVVALRPESAENLPAGVDGSAYQWVDLDGEGLSGILAEQAGAWFFKPNDGGGVLGPVQAVASIPSTAALGSGHQQLIDLAGDGQLDLVEFGGPVAGFFERTNDGQWAPFRNFLALPDVNWGDPNLRFVDLTGDGHADLLISQDDALVWHASLAEDGFDAGERVATGVDEEHGPRLLFADGTQSIYLADMSGDGLTDLVRIRNGEVCYWPNLGYGRFGPKVSMDDAPWFDTADQFNQQRLRLADIDGSGPTDLIYLGRDGVHLYYNRSGNGWSPARTLGGLPRIDNLASVTVADLLGNGTACLLWSSPLPTEAGRALRFVDLMGGQKPHLLTRAVNNLGAETDVEYAPSTKFYLADKQNGTPWITRLPFPVHVVERVMTQDRIGRTRFVTRYAYHHGLFEGVEREFRGFGMVEQWDAESFAALGDVGEGGATNAHSWAQVPPVLTRTWFHTGAYAERGVVSKHYEQEYYREGDGSSGSSGLTVEQAEKMLLDDSVLPVTALKADGARSAWALSIAEEREALRALKGSILRQEVYADDGTAAARRPFSTSERSYGVELLQPQGDNRHAVFFVHSRETVDFHYERRRFKVTGSDLALDQENPPANALDACDPRVGHSFTFEVNEFGNVLLGAAVAYGRRYRDSSLTTADRSLQRSPLLTLSRNGYTNAVLNQPDAYRVRLPSESRTYELINVPPDENEPGITNLFRWAELRDRVAAAGDGQHDLDYEDVEAKGAADDAPYQRLVECQKTKYRRDDMTALLPLGRVDSLAWPGESYRLAFTPGLLAQVLRRDGVDLLPDPDAVLMGTAGDKGGYVKMELDPGVSCWWRPSGRIYYSAGPNDPPAAELAFALAHFGLPRRFEDPFQQPTNVRYDAYDLLLEETEDVLQNLTVAENDYRVLQPRMVTDPNGNPVEAAYDGLGLLVATAVRGGGDEINGIVEDPTQAQIDAFMADPVGTAALLLGNATTRIVYDVLCYQQEPDPDLKPPVVAATLSRETHLSQPEPKDGPRIQIAFSYSDGFRREVQRKSQAEAGPVPERDGATGEILADQNGQPTMTTFDVFPRWVGGGWTIFNNKGQPVRQFEPFFTDVHQFEFEPRIGVSPYFFHDPVGRVVATLHPNHTWEKVVFEPWRQELWDVNDCLVLDPATDPDLKGFFLDPEGGTRLPDDAYPTSWYAERLALPAGDPDRDAAIRSEPHAGTPTVVHLDPLGRSILSLAHNGREADGTPILFATRTTYDIEGKPLTVRDALGRVAMDYRMTANGGMRITGYDVAGNQLYQNSMDSGERWILQDVSGKPLRRWDGRDHTFLHAYDELRRPVSIRVQGGDGPVPLDHVYDLIVYGEGQVSAGLGDQANGLRGRIFEHYDLGGRLRCEQYDFNGNPHRGVRQVAIDYRSTPDWSGDPEALLEAESFTTTTEYDALNRVTATTTPDGSRTSPFYNEANLLEGVEVTQGGITTGIVTDIDYNSKGQRLRIAYGNGVVTTYEYEKATFRLATLVTIRGQATLQDLEYTYDPSGNITRIRDNAQPTVFFDNMMVEPVNEYWYDPLYRLLEAAGREHRGQIDAGQEDNWDDWAFLKQYSAGDPMVWRNYTESYDYDAVGNIREVTHDAGVGSWTRTNTYAVGSNRIQSSNFLGVDYAFQHHPWHGFMTGMPHLPVMEWNCRDELQAVSRQIRNEGKPETTYYVYDATGQRLRCVTDGEAGVGAKPARLKERIYLGAAELYREVAGQNAGLERWTLHVIDGRQRIALIETRNDVDDGSPKRIVRYQHANHLGSAIVESDDSGKVFSYEEYHPYGTTAYQAVSRDVRVASKQYRYAARERDDDSGLYRHTARYLCPWLGRWVSPDPEGIVDGNNLYAYVSDRPIVYTDPHGAQAEPFVPLVSVEGNVVRFPVLSALKELVSPKGKPLMVSPPSLPPEGVVNRKAIEEAVTSILKPGELQVPAGLGQPAPLLFPSPRVQQLGPVSAFPSSVGEYRAWVTELVLDIVRHAHGSGGYVDTNAGLIPPRPRSLPEEASTIGGVLKRAWSAIDSQTSASKLVKGHLMDVLHSSPGEAALALGVAGVGALAALESNPKLFGKPLREQALGLFSDRSVSAGHLTLGSESGGTFTAAIGGNVAQGTLGTLSVGLKQFLQVSGAGRPQAAGSSLSLSLTDIGLGGLGILSVSGTGSLKLSAPSGTLEERFMLSLSLRQ